MGLSGRLGNEKGKYRINYPLDVYKEVIKDLERFYKKEEILRYFYKDEEVREGEFEGHKFFTNYNLWRESIEKAEKNNLFYVYGWFHPGSPSEINELWWEFIKENKVPYGDKIDPKKSYKPFLGDRFTFEDIRKFFVELSSKGDRKQPYGPLLTYISVLNYIYLGGYEGKRFPEIVEISPHMFRRVLSSTGCTRIQKYFEDLEKTENYPDKVNPFYVFLLKAHDPEREKIEKIKRIDVGFDIPPATVYRENGRIENMDLHIPIFSLEARYKKNEKQPEIIFYLRYGIYPVDDLFFIERLVLVPKK